MMKTLLFSLLTLASFGLPGAHMPQVSAPAPPSDSRIVVSPGDVRNRVSPWMYGSCIEDVNHEIYGGLYAQRIFGESFEEPPSSPVSGWTGYGGAWNLRDGALQVEAAPGAKLVRQGPPIGDGSIACDVRFADGTGDNAGLIVRVSDPHPGPDAWVGYEISLSIRNQYLILGRHCHNWEPLKSVPVAILPGRWYRLRADLSGATLRLFVDDGATPLLEYTDDQNVLQSGQVGLRTWNSNASFRRLTVTAGGQTVTENFEQATPDDNALAISAAWDPVVTGSARSRFTWEAGDAYNSRHAQQVAFVGGAGTVGVANRSLNRWGIAVRQEQAMQGHCFVRGTGALVVALQSADGLRTYAQTRLAAASETWTRRDFRLRPSVTDPHARFACWLERPGSVTVDQVYLSDTGAGLFRGGPFRADIGNALVRQGLTFLRYGGTMVNAPGYRWKQMIGDRDKRPQYRGHWYPYSTNGFGIEEFLQFCEAAHIEPAVALNIDETPQDAADFVEYVNGPVTSVWGAKRVANGHPKPYHLRYIEIGNEEGLDGSADWYRRYLERFKLLYATMRPRDPSVRYVIAAWWNADEPLCKQIVQELGDKAALWDVHVDADNLRDADRVDQTLTRMQQLFAAWIPGSSLHACIFEENGNRHDFQRALGHARILNVTQRHGDFVEMDCPANCLQPLGQNDSGWDQGQVFFSPDQVWGMPPYYAQQMAAENHQPLRVACETVSPSNDLDVTVTKSTDGKTLVLKIVNSGAVPHHADLQVRDFVPQARADVWTLTGALDAVNTPSEPERVRSVHTTLTNAPLTRGYTFAPHSYTIFRLRRK